MLRNKATHLFWTVTDGPQFPYAGWAHQEQPRLSASWWHNSWFGTRTSCLTGLVPNKLWCQWCFHKGCDINKFNISRSYCDAFSCVWKPGLFTCSCGPVQSLENCARSLSSRFNDQIGNFRKGAILNWSVMVHIVIMSYSACLLPFYRAPADHLRAKRPQMKSVSLTTKGGYHEDQIKLSRLFYTFRTNPCNSIPCLI